MLANIPQPNTLFLDQKTGMMAIPWYQFFAQQSVINQSGAPASSVGSNGNYYFRTDGSPGAYIYFKSGGAWTAIL